jgi:hypothetical protein
MPTATYTPLANVTLGSSASSVTFSSIPATYRDLILVFEGSVNTGDRVVAIRFNSDSGSNYSRVQMAGTGSSTSSSPLSGTATDFYYQATASQQTNAVVQIMDYTATDKHKSMVSRANTPAAYVFANAHRWASTAAITSLQVFPATGSYGANGSFNIGSTFSLYGVIA